MIVLMTKARPLLIILFAMGWAAWPVSTDGQLRRIAATNPVAAASAIELQGGFRADLIAAEPLVTDPIAMQYDENGLAYVVVCRVSTRGSGHVSATFCCGGRLW